MTTARTLVIMMAAGMLLAGQAAHAVTVEVDQLGSQTVTRSNGTGSIASSQYNDNAIDGDTVVSSNADITFAFEMTIKDLTPASNRSLFEFGGGNGTGFSLLHRGIGDFTLQVEQGTKQIGGNALVYTLPAVLLNQQISVVASLDTDATSSTLNLFINDNLVGTATGAGITDWAGTDPGGYFSGNDAVLAASFGQQNFNGPTAAEATANSSLRFYQDVFAVPSTAPDPEPTFYFLNTEGSNPGLGNIDSLNFDGTVRTNLLDVDPTPFGSVQDWKGFATDGDYYYFLNTNGNATYQGNIDRVNLDGTGRTTVVDIAPSPFTAIDAWRGFATDGEFFYLLQTGQTNPNLGRIDRINLDGTGRTTLMDIDPSPYGAIEAWQGLATDGEFFYLLQTGQGNPNLGRIDRINMDGTGRITLLDVDPTTFGAIENWRGFAAAVPSAAVPEPATMIALFAAITGLGGYVRRRKRA